MRVAMRCLDLSLTSTTSTASCSVPSGPWDRRSCPPPEAMSTDDGLPRRKWPRPDRVNAAGHPDRVTHIIPVDIPPSLFRDPNSPQQQFSKRVAEQGHPTFEDHDAALEWVRTTNQTTPDEPLRHRLSHLLKQLDGKWTFRHDPRVGFHWSPTDLWDELPKIQAPVLIVRGGKSQVLAGKTADRMRDAFPSAELFTSEESGHTVPEDTAELFIQAVEDFLKRNPG